MGILAHGVFAMKRRSSIAFAGLAFAVTLGAAVWLALPSHSTYQNRPPPTGRALDASALAAATQDSDGDGLRDWEEALWRTDPQNSDSDGDGTPDGEEIRRNRDPLKRGPKDGVAQLPTGDAAVAPSDDLTYNLTKSLLDSGILNDINARGELTSSDFLQKLSLPGGFDAGALFRITAVRPTDLAADPRSDADTVRRYFDAVALVYNRRIVPHQTRGDLAILVESLHSNDFLKLAELDPLIVELGQAIAEIKRLPVPVGYADIAVKELNYLGETKRLVEIFRNTPNDPVSTVIAVQKRLALLQEMAQFHLEVSRTLQEKGIAGRS